MTLFRFSDRFLFSAFVTRGRLAGLMLTGALMFLLSTVSPAQERSEAGIELDNSWKQGLYRFATEHLQHSAWGLQHSERNYLLALELAEREGLELDTDVLFAAAFLHDLGALDGFSEPGADHSEVSASTVEEVLEPLDFPMEKTEAVQRAILAHMYYADVPEDNAARLLHDADTLDFLGAIGVARILSLTERHSWATDLSTALETLTRFHEELPATLSTDAAKAMGQRRAEEGRRFIEQLRAQSVQGDAL